MDVISHLWITRAALEALPGWQQEMLAEETENLVNLYSIYPDIWRWKESGDTHDNAVKYGHIPTRETRPYCVLPDGTPAGVSAEPEASAPATLFYIERALSALAKRNIPETAKYLGSFAHYLQDHGCAAHIAPGVLGSLTSLDPPPDDDIEYVSLHYMFENEDTPYEAHLDGYRPKLLGRTPHEMVFHMGGKYLEIERAKLRSVMPYLRALYRRDDSGAARARSVTGTVTGEVLADFLYTVLCISAGRIDSSECEKLDVVDLSTVAPAKVVSRVTDAYFGCAVRNAALGEFTDYGWPRRPLQLNVAGKHKVFARGLGVGVDLKLIYRLHGAFSRFQCLAGLHAELAREGSLAFSVEVDEKTVFESGELTVADPPQSIDVSVQNAETLALITRRVRQRPGSSGQRTEDHGVWAEPVLVT